MEFNTIKVVPTSKRYCQLTLAYKPICIFLYTDGSNIIMKCLPSRFKEGNTCLLEKGIKVEINSEVVTNKPAVIEQNSNAQEIKRSTEKNNLDDINTEVPASNNVYVSTQGKLSQEIDAASDKIDDILLSHVTPAQEDKLNDIYQQLDKIFEKEELTEKEEKSANDLFEQVHNILDSSVNKLTSSERETVDKLVSKMDGLITQLEQSDTSRSPNKNSTSDKSSVSDDLSSILSNEKKTNKKRLTVSELNALSALELNKLPANQLKKLNAQQLNKLNASQLNSLALPQLKQLSANNLGKLNQSQMNKVS